MSYDSQETSVQDSVPIMLYRVAVGNSATYYYTTAKETIVYDGHSWVPEVIECSKIKRSGDLANDNVTIKVPLSNALSVLYLANAVDEVVTIAQLRYQSGTGTARGTWDGRVLHTEPEAAAMGLVCEPDASSIRRMGLTQLYSRECRFEVGQRGCNVDLEPYENTFTLTAVAGNKVRMVFVVDAGNLVGGTLRATNGAERLIIDQVVINSQTFLVELTLLHALASLAVGSSVTVCPGCDGSMTMCAYYNNVGNNGGWPGMRYINPFSDVRSIFNA